jgi:murein DD-endopeptidase MepM/ murein hydrolase activator NlpD
MTVSYTRRRHSQSPVPLRFIALGLLVLTVGYWLWPSADSDDGSIAAVTAQAPVAPELAAETMELAKSGDSDLGINMKEVLNSSPQISSDDSTADDPVLKPSTAPATNIQTSAIETKNQQDNVVAGLVDIEPAAGLPVARGGVYLPEPRPEIFEMINLSAAEMTARLMDLENKGVRPVSVKIKSGDTLAEALTKRLNVGARDTHYAIESLAAIFDPRDVRPGQTVTAYAAPDASEPRLMALTLQKDMLSSVIATRVSADRFVTSEVQRPTTRKLRAVRGEIKNSLYLATNAEGVPDRVTLELIRIYSWSIDFQRDIRANDRFEIMYEEYQTDDGEVVPGKGEILYATLTLGNKPYSMYRYEMSDQRVDFFEPDGQSVRKALMKTPVNGARISSGFGRRHHPVLGYSKMHKGTDFAAPTGTPIYAAGDGVIERSSRYGSFGNYIKIRHRSNLKTAYAHLNGFARGIHSGKRVRQGDVIGYIGTTGRSTGPHLHYEVHVNGKQVNPGSVKLPTGEKLAASDLAAFKRHVRELNSEFAAKGLGQTVVAQKMGGTGAVNTN